MGRSVRTGIVCLAVLGAVLSTACDRDQSPTIVTPSAGPTVTAPAPPVTSTTFIEGAIESITAPDTIVIGGKRIVLDPQAAIRRGAVGLTFSDLSLGLQSRVTAQSDGATFRGTLVEVTDQVGTPMALHGVID